MKIKDLRDDETVYVLLNKENSYIIEIAHIDKNNAMKKKEQIQELFPWLEISVCETVASDLPRDFDIYEKMVESKLNEEKIKLDSDYFNDAGCTKKFEDY